MKVIKANKTTFDKREAYKLTKGETKSIQEATGLVLDVETWLEYEDQNQKGDTVRVLAIMDKEGQVYSTISETFKQRFYEIVDIFGDELPGILVTTGTSKAGRSYMSCTIE